MAINNKLCQRMKEDIAPRGPESVPKKKER